jgi:branched-chain amino acid transport system permease protein
MTVLGLNLSTTLLSLLLLNALLAYSAYPTFAVGRLNVSFVAFSGLGGYTAAILNQHYGVTPVLTFIAAVVLAGAVAFPLAVVFRRISGVYLSIATITLAAVFQILIINLPSLTGGALGIPGLPILTNWRILLIVMLVVVAGFFLVARSERGTAMRLQREDELLALSVGVNVQDNVARLFVASAAVAALQGCLTAYWYGFVSPETYSFSAVILAIAMVVLGGSAEWVGPLIGAIFFTIVPEWLRPFGIWRDIATGTALLFVVLVFPKGLAGYIVAQRRLHRARSSREATARSGGAIEHVQPARGTLE